MIDRSFFDLVAYRLSSLGLLSHCVTSSLPAQALQVPEPI